MGLSEVMVLLEMLGLVGYVESSTMSMFALIWVNKMSLWMSLDVVMFCLDVRSVVWIGYVLVVESEWVCL